MKPIQQIHTHMYIYRHNKNELQNNHISENTKWANHRDMVNNWKDEYMMNNSTIKREIRENKSNWKVNWIEKYVPDKLGALTSD